MAKKESYSKFKEQILETEESKAINRGESLRLQSEIRRGVADMPINRIFLAYQFVDNEILPALEAHKGKDSADYKQYQEIASALMWIIVLTDRDEYLRKEVVQFKMLADYYRKRCAWLETELLRFTTLEDLLLSQSLDHYKTAVVNRAADIINQKK